MKKAKLQHKGLFKEQPWNPTLHKKVIGNLVTICFSDVKYTLTGICFWPDNGPHGIHDCPSILTSKLEVLTIDGPEQVVAIKPFSWKAIK